MIDTLVTEPLESATLQKMSFYEKKILLGAINGVIDKHHAAWLLSAEKRKQYHFANTNNKAPDTSVDASKKKKIKSLYVLLVAGIIAFFMTAVTDSGAWFGWYIILGGLYLLIKMGGYVSSVVKRKSS